MNDSISRQAAIRWVKTECNPYGKPTLEFESGKKVIEHLEQMPSAQPEIIRCKDCKHRIVNEHAGEKGYFNLKAMCELDSGDPFELGRCAEDDEWFCADAERREDETDRCECANCRNAQCDS